MSYPYLDLWTGGTREYMNDVYGPTVLETCHVDGCLYLPDGDNCPEAFRAMYITVISTHLQGPPILESSIPPISVFPVHLHPLHETHPNV